MTGARMPAAPAALARIPARVAPDAPTHADPAIAARTRGAVMAVVPIRGQTGPVAQTPARAAVDLTAGQAAATGIPVGIVTAAGLTHTAPDTDATGANGVTGMTVVTVDAGNAHSGVTTSITTNIDIRPSAAGSAT
ncbi:MAG: hypothetical protein ACJA0K_001974 [Maricaulis maris]|jgi:hypothetical protein